MKVTSNDRKILDALRARIHDPAATPEERDSLRDDFEAIAGGYVAERILNDDWEAEGNEAEGGINNKIT